MCIMILITRPTCDRLNKFDRIGWSGIGDDYDTSCGDVFHWLESFSQQLHVPQLQISNLVKRWFDNRTKNEFLYFFCNFVSPVVS
jgi:hypothetical protein